MLLPGYNIINTSISAYSPTNALLTSNTHFTTTPPPPLPSSLSLLLFFPSYPSSLFFLLRKTRQSNKHSPLSFPLPLKEKRKKEQEYNNERKGEGGIVRGGKGGGEVRELREGGEGFNVVLLLFRLSC